MAAGDDRFSSPLDSPLAKESTFRRLLDAAPDAVVIVNRAGRIVLANAQAQKMFGYTEQEFLGELVEMLLPEGARGVHVGQREQYVAAPRTRPMGAGLDLSGRRRDGSTFPVEISLAPIASDGDMLVMSAIRDVTDRKRIEETLRTSEAKFRRLLELAPDGIVLADEAGRILLANSEAQKLFGYTEAEMLGQPVEILLPEAMQLQHVRHREAYAAAPRTRSMGAGYELAGRHKDGSMFPVEISLAPMPSEDGLLIMSAIRDVTDRKRAEAQINALNEDLQRRVAELAAVNRELEAFSYSVSHDLRAPLRSIDGFSQALLEDYGERIDEQGHEYLARVRAATQRMGELIDDLLNLARVTRREMRREPVDLSLLARATAAQLRRSDPARSVEFVIANRLVADGDPHLLRVALENLLANAWKFTGREQHPRIEFGATQHGGQRAYFVRDNGVGFDMAYTHKLFGAFQRLHRSSEFPGTGIGLATVQRIVNRHGGRVWAEAAVGKGATFYFTLG